MEHEFDTCVHSGMIALGKSEIQILMISCTALLFPNFLLPHLVFEFYDYPSQEIIDQYFVLPLD